MGTADVKRNVRYIRNPNLNLIWKRSRKEEGMEDALKRRREDCASVCAWMVWRWILRKRRSVPNVRVKNERLNIPVYLSKKIRGTWQPHKTYIILNFFSLADSASSIRVALGKSIPISRRRKYPRSRALPKG